MQLSDADLRVWMMDGKLVIEGFREENLTPNGYDVTVAEVLIEGRDEPVKKGSAMVPPKTRFMIGTDEFFELGPRLVADIWLRTTWARRGIMSSFGKVDAGFRGNLTLGGFNASEEEVEIAVGDTFAQVTFHELRSAPTLTYGERSGNYQDQVGITPSKSSGRRRSGPE